MTKIKKTIFLILYYAVGYHLPNYSYPMGKLFNAFRIFLLRKIIPVGNTCRIMRHVYIGNGNNIEIGDGCRINEGIRLDNVKIGNHVLIARESIFLGKMHEFGDIELPISKQGRKNVERTVIEDDVWLGLRVMVMPGLSLRKGSIIGAGAVVTKSTVEYGIYGGVPAKLIKMRNE